MFSRSNPSKAYLAALADSKRFQKENKTFAGDRTFKAFAYLDMMCREHRPRTLLDYGAGKGLQFSSRNVPVKRFAADGVIRNAVIPSLQEALGVETITPYDPAIPGIDTLPAGPFDGVYSVDVMQFIGGDDAPWVIAEMGNLATKFLFVKFRCTQPRDKKTTAVQMPTSAFWIDTFESEVRPEVDLCVRLRDEDNHQMYCRRKPFGKMVVETAQ